MTQVWEPDNWPNCDIPDCEYQANPSTGKCYAHGKGKNPIMTYKKYCELNKKYGENAGITSLGEEWNYDNFSIY
jgi:hypothetical protein